MQIFSDDIYCLKAWHCATFDALTKQWDDLTKEILAHKEFPPPGEETFWSELRNLIDPETGNPISYETLRAEVATVIVGGSEAIGYQIAWIITLLASNTHVIDKVLAELKEHKLYGEDARELEFEDLFNLDYVTAVVKEGLRIADISVTASVRTIQENITLMGYRIPKNVVLVYPGNRSINDEKMWKYPRVFMPEKWLGDEDIAHKYFLEFGCGPRDCIGKRYAMMKMRLIVIELCKRYSMELVGTFEECAQNTEEKMSIFAKNGIWMNFSSKNH